MLKNAIESLFNTAERAIEQRHADTISETDLEQFLVLDVREDHEFSEGHLPGAISLPRSRLEMECADCEPLTNNNKPVLVYCKSGRRSLLAAKTLQELGVDGPVSMAGGVTAWEASGKELA